jgi:hypothetical protein
MPLPATRLRFATPGGREGRRIRLRAFREFHQRRQEPGQGLAGAGRGDQQRRASRLRLLEQGQLVFARRPAACFEPAAEAVGKQCSVTGGITGAHGPRLGSLPCPVEDAGFHAEIDHKDLIYYWFFACLSPDGHRRNPGPDGIVALQIGRGAP